MITSTDIHYAQRLRGLRLGRDLKQKQAADLIGLDSQQTYSKLENGQLSFTDELIQKICTAFEIKPEEFTSTGSNVSINNSPNSPYNSNSPNSFINDISLINTALAAKQETIDALKALVQNYEKQLAEKDMTIDALRKKLS